MRVVLSTGTANPRSWRGRLRFGGTRRLHYLLVCLWCISLCQKSLTGIKRAPWLWLQVLGHRCISLCHIALSNYRSRKLEGSTNHWDSIWLKLVTLEMVPEESQSHRSLSLITVRKPEYYTPPSFWISSLKVSGYRCLCTLAAPAVSSSCPDGSIFHSRLSPGSETEKLNLLFSLEKREDGHSEGEA